MVDHLNVNQSIFIIVKKSITEHPSENGLHWTIITALAFRWYVVVMFGASKTRSDLAWLAWLGVGISPPTWHILPPIMISVYIRRHWDEFRGVSWSYENDRRWEGLDI